MEVRILPKTSTNNKNNIPTLRRNRKIEDKWGIGYHNAVKEAIFGFKTAPYTPLEPPPFLSEYIGETEPLYTCEECRDCFRFHSSFQEHNNRRSWILGYWCQHCFLTVCKHVPAGQQICITCAKLDSEKRMYLRCKGLKKGQKLGATKVFFNHCQFFAHLRSHSLTLVDMGDLMLLPLPNANTENLVNFEILCEALIEHTFILRVHLMDWLKIEDIHGEWWKILEEETDNHNNPIMHIYRKYEGRKLFPVHSSISSMLKQTATMEHSDIPDNARSANLDESILEDEDNPCTSADITFVDCGPTQRYFAQENLIKTQESKKFKKSPKCNSQYMRMIAPKGHINHNKSNKNEPIPTKLLNEIPIANNNDVVSQESEIKKNSENHKFDKLFSISQKQVSIMQSPIVSIRPKLQPKPIPAQISNVLKIPNEQYVEFATIISHISPHLGKKQQIVLIGKDSKTDLQQKAETSSTQNKITTLEQKDLHVLTNYNNKALPNLVEDNVIMNNNEKLQKTLDDVTMGFRVENHEKDQNNLKKAVNDAQALAVSNEILISPSKLFDFNVSPSDSASSLLENNPLLLTPSPSQSEISNCSTEAQNKSIALSSEKSQIRKLSPVFISELKDRNICELEFMYIQKVRDSFYLVHSPKVKERIKNLSKLRKRFIQDVYSVREGNVARQFRCLKESLNKCSEFQKNTFSHKSHVDCNSGMTNIQNLILFLNGTFYNSFPKSKKIEEPENIEESSLDWENDLIQPASCLSCKKLVKPASYIPGISKPAKDESIYCLCYKFMCHECLVFQINEARFAAHKRYHKKKEPYVCPVCFKSFETFDLLEIHSWTYCFHNFKKRVFGCKICEIEGFTDIESVARHFDVLHSTKKIACEKCSIVLDSILEYNIHCDSDHAKDIEFNPIKLVVCKYTNRAVLSSKYIKHMDGHFGVRKLNWLVCPLCNFQLLNNNENTTELLTHIFCIHRRKIQEIMKPNIFLSVIAIMKDKLKQKENSCTKKKDSNRTTMPKIINTRTITSEVFERGSDNIDKINIDSLEEIEQDSHSNVLPRIVHVRSISELMPIDLEPPQRSVTLHLNNDKEKSMSSKTQESEIDSDVSERLSVASNRTTNEFDEMLFEAEEETKSMNFIEPTSEEALSESVVDKPVTSKPPPLARIPRQENTKIKETNENNKISKKNSNHKKKTQQRPWRIAFNGPSNTTKPQQYSCHVCGDLINTSWPVIKAHFTSKHSIEYKLSIVTPRLLRLSHDFINNGYKELCNNKKRKLELSGSASKRRRRWTPKKYADSKRSNSPLGLFIKPESPKDKEGNFICKKCNENCSDIERLRNHIANSHRIKGRYLVCLECGENFVVATSLQMHLKAFHRIEDPITYMSQNPAYAPDMMDDMEGIEKTTEPNQCYVCKAVFEDKAAVDKHLRVHGMAFLNRKRIEARRALNDLDKKVPSPSIKPLIEQSKESAIRKEHPAETIREKLNAIL